MTTPVKGFMKIAEALVKERPGLAAEEYARMALDRGIAQSNSKDPVQSLATTLMKQVREGRTTEIYADQVRGKLRYYPTGDLLNPPGRRLPHLLFTDVRMSPDTAKRVRTLLEVGLFANEKEAASWLLEEGVRAQRDTLDQIESQAEEIERRKEVARNLIRVTTLDLPLIARGKVRDVYDLGDKLLIVATDRLSAFDVVLPTAIPDKGAVLTQMSAFWFEKTGDIVPNHFIRVVESTRVPEVPVELPREMIGRSMVVKKAERIDVECVVRGYITGSGWADYKKAGAVSGIKLPEGLEESQELHDPIFTPTTKASEGHDMPITYNDVKELAGDQAANAMRVRALAVYRFGRDYARERGIIIADTKFEFGMLDGEVILIDEALTPDSSRFWPEDEYVVGKSPPSFDKQYVRDYLSALGWDKTPPGPELPAEVVEKTAEKYREAFERITGRTLVTP